MFTSETKFESGTGWPSFYAPISKKRVREVDDRKLGMLRTKGECARCGSHSGHVFDDGPKPAGLPYINHGGITVPFLPEQLVSLSDDERFVYSLTFHEKSLGKVI